MCLFALMSHDCQHSCLPCCTKSVSWSLKKTVVLGQEEPFVCLSSTQGVCKARRTCSFWDMKQMFQEEKSSGIQTLQKTDAPSIYASEKNCDKKLSQLLCRAFQAPWSRLRHPQTQEGQKARKSFRHMHSHITLKKVGSIQEIHPCVGYSTLQDCCCAEKSKVSGFVDQIHLWTT